MKTIIISAFPIFYNMKKLALIFLLIFNIGNLKAQPNLVPNPSFENYFNLNANGTSLESFIYNWYGGRGYFHSLRTNTSGFSIPMNDIGHQFARTGNAYCGIYTYGKYSYPIRQYIQTKLDSALEGNKKYRVAFYISLGDTMHAFNNSIGAFFAPDSLLSYNNYIVDASPQIENNNENDLNNKTEWTLVCDTFIAAGGERWLTIGNFLNDSLSAITEIDTNICNQPMPYNCGAYYYIDDVSVTLIDETGIEEQKQNNFTLFPNPNKGNFKLQYYGIINKKTTLYITDVYGKFIDTKEILNTTTDYENTSLLSGLYFYSLSRGNEEVGRGKFLIVK
jgi:hypothetical protein